MGESEWSHTFSCLAGVLEEVVLGFTADTHLPFSCMAVVLEVVDPIATAEDFSMAEVLQEVVPASSFFPPRSWSTQEDDARYPLLFIPAGIRFSCPLTYIWSASVTDASSVSGATDPRRPATFVVPAVAWTLLADSLLYGVLNIEQTWFTSLFSESPVRSSLHESLQWSIKLEAPIELYVV